MSGYEKGRPDGQGQFGTNQPVKSVPEAPGELGGAQEQLLQAGKVADLCHLISTVAHDVSNPLTGVLGLAELLLRRELEEGVKRDVQSIYKETQKALHILKDMVAYVRNMEA